MAEANELNDHQPQSKSLVVLNESEDYDVTMYIYSGWSPICKVSNTSKIIPPLQKCFYQEETFKFELVAILKDKQDEDEEQNKKEKKKSLLGPLEMDEDKFIRVTNSLECEIEKLADHPNRKRVCLREVNRAKELAVGADKPNLYQVLGLDMDKVRKMDKNDMERVINKAYHKQMRIWHPDKNFGDAEVAIEIIMAKEILLDGERRARYHNGVDYDKGWLSPDKWKAIFWPDCYTTEQSIAFWKRIGMTALSLGLVAGGIALTVSTGGAALPAIALCGFSMASWKSLKYTVSRESVVDGVKVTKWLKEARKGFIMGAATGGIGLGLTAIGEVADLVGELGATDLLEAGEEIISSALEAAPRNFIEAGLKSVANTTQDFVKERLDDAIENQSPIQHVKSGFTKFAITTVAGITQAVSRDIKGEENENEREEPFGKNLVKEGFNIGLKSVLKKDLDDDEKNEKSENCNRDIPHAEQEVDKPEGRITYRTEGYWFSKMVVKYSLNGRNVPGKVSGDGTYVDIPADAKDIEVQFQVSRPHWGPIMKFDRFKQEWWTPNQPHVFRYDNPVIRTFTISGPLWWERIIKVSDEHHEETKERS